jgi:hypothetical protein
VLALAVPTSVFGQARVGTTAATFLTVGAGARGSALGHAYTAAVQGPDALFWNPGAASIPYLDRHRGGALFSHHNWFADIAYNAAAVVVPVTGSGVLGLSMSAVDYGRMKVRTVSQPEGTGETFSATDLSIGLTWSQPLTTSFYFGGTVNYIRQAIRDMSAQTAAIDVGFVLVTRYLNGMKLAASIRNFGGKLEMGGVNAEFQTDVDESVSGSSDSVPAELKMSAWDLPLQFRFGIAVPAISTENVEVLLLGDANQTNDNDLNGDFGGQFRYRTNSVTFDARIGYKDLFLDDQAVTSHLSYGAGVEVRVASVRFGFDYAYVPHDYLDKTQMLDFRLFF